MSIINHFNQINNIHQNSRQKNDLSLLVHFSKIDPNEWNIFQTKQWIEDVKERYSKSHCNTSLLHMDGSLLVNLPYETFVAACNDSLLGGALYGTLKKQIKEFKDINKTTDYELYKDTILLTLTGRIKDLENILETKEYQLRETTNRNLFLEQELEKLCEKNNLSFKNYQNILITSPVSPTSSTMTNHFRKDYDENNNNNNNNNNNSNNNNNNQCNNSNIANNNNNNNNDNYHSGSKYGKCGFKPFCPCTGFKKQADKTTCGSSKCQHSKRWHTELTHNNK